MSVAVLQSIYCESAKFAFLTRRVRRPTVGIYRFGFLVGVGKTRKG